jgi:putative salt-induced outer membrane protein YdiY
MRFETRSPRWVPVAALALCAVLAGAARADQIVMKNGDRVTGSIIKQDGKTITVKTANFGVVTAPWDQVESITSDTPVTVALKDGKSVAGKLATAEGKVQVAGVAVAPADVTAIRNADEQRNYERLLRPGMLDLWSGSGSLGFAGANGNARTLTFTTAANAARVTRTDKMSLYFNVIKASATVNQKSSSTAQAVRGGWGYEHNVSSRFFLSVFNDYEYDKFQNVDLRFVLGAGAGVHVWKHERSTLDFSAGAGYNHSSFGDGSSRSSAEAFWGYEYFYKLSSASSFTHGFRMFNDLSHTGDYRMNADLGIATKLRKWLSWNVSLSDRFLSNPSPGRKTNDWLYSTGLGVTFSR